jgi:hypothetical protein
MKLVRRKTHRQKNKDTIQYKTNKNKYTDVNEYPALLSKLRRYEDNYCYHYCVFEYRLATDQVFCIIQTLKNKSEGSILNICEFHESQYAANNGENGHTYGGSMNFPERKTSFQTPRPMI